MHAYVCSENSERIYIQMSSTQQRGNRIGKEDMFNIVFLANVNITVV